MTSDEGGYFCGAYNWFCKVTLKAISTRAADLLRTALSHRKTARSGIRMNLRHERSMRSSVPLAMSLWQATCASVGYDLYGHMNAFALIACQVVAMWPCPLTASLTYIPGTPGAMRRRAGAAETPKKVKQHVRPGKCFFTGFCACFSR